MSDMVVEKPDRVCIEPIKPGSFWIGIYKDGKRQCVVFHAAEKTDWVGETFPAVRAHAYKDEDYARFTNDKSRLTPALPEKRL